jgi:hypothetical protein
MVFGPGPNFLDTNLPQGDKDPTSSSNYIEIKLEGTPGYIFTVESRQPITEAKLTQYNSAMFWVPKESMPMMEYITEAYRKGVAKLPHGEVPPYFISYLFALEGWEDTTTRAEAEDIFILAGIKPEDIPTLAQVKALKCELAGDVGFNPDSVMDEDSTKKPLKSSLFMAQHTKVWDILLSDREEDKEARKFLENIITENYAAMINTLYGNLDRGIQYGISFEGVTPQENNLPKLKDIRLTLSIENPKLIEKTEEVIRKNNPLFSLKKKERQPNNFKSVNTYLVSSIDN